MSDYPYNKNKTNKGRIIIRKRGEDIPTLSKYNYQLWKFCISLEPNELMVLISKRKEDLKYEKDFDIIKNLRTEILLLEDTYKIMIRKNKKIKD